MSELWFSRNHNYVKTACVCFDFGINLHMRTNLAGKTKVNRKNNAWRVVQQIYTSFVTVNFGNIMPDRKTKTNNSKNMIVLFITES